MDEKGINKSNIRRDLERFESDLEPLVTSMVLGEFTEVLDIPIYENSPLEKLQAITKLIVDGFYEQWLEMSNAKKEIEKSKQELELTLNRLEQFTYVASHELRAPLVNIKELIALNKIVPSEEIDQRIESAVSSFDGALTELILTISGSELPQKKDFFYCNSVIRDCFEKYVAPISDEAILDLSKAKFIGYADQELFKKVLKQLMLNSINFKKPTVDPIIKIVVTEKENGIQIDYSDNSIGMNLPEDEERLFDLYRTGLQGNTGRGVGMHLVKSIIAMMDGEIVVSGKEGEGINYCINLYK